ncbi:hypothetical protein [Nocardia terpenica]|uniref:hypothetical protein n=1 Tax=Nocardia terpenica TaxID=455432 RepID=UPI00082E5FD7|nr:hypothetical protein [Nocardia terpenica]NQE89672.1 hypothetical protein [Nocardia terpenica]
MRTSYGVVETVTACLATLVAGLSLLLPIDFAWTADTTTLQLDLLAYSLPRAIAAGALVAVIVAVMATTVNHALAAWGSALCGITIMLINHLIGHRGDPGVSLPTLNFIDSLSGGILLGGIAVAVLHGRMQVFGWTLGGLGSVVIGAAMPTGHIDEVLEADRPMHWPATDSPPLWLIELTVALVALGTLVNRHRTGVERRSVELPMAPILAGLLFVTITLFGAEWLTRRADDTADIALAVAAIVVAGLIAAMLLPRRDGTLILLAVSLSAVGGALMPAWLPGWAAAPLVALTGFGILLGFRRPAPMATLVLLAMLALGNALTAAAVGHERTRAATISVLLAVLAGYCFGSAAPRYNPTRVLGLSIVFVPSIVPALRDRVSRGDFTDVTVDGGHWYVCQVPMASSPIPSWTALAVTTGCIVGLIALRRWRTPTPNRTVETAESGEERE